MDIGTKIKEARIAAALTQEQVAEILGVSRQTISNWENNKTYPDIMRVIKLSDLYAVSLDYLLKDKEPSGSNYVDYLEESTNTVKGKTRLAKIVLISIYLGIWALALMMFWFFAGGSDAMGFGVVFLWMILPVTTFVLSLVIGKYDYWHKQKWFAAIAFGLMYMLAEYATFGTANMLAFDKINRPDWGMALAGAIISSIGLGIGTLANHRNSKKG